MTVSIQKGAIALCGSVLFHFSFISSETKHHVVKQVVKCLSFFKWLQAAIPFFIALPVSV